MLFGGSYWTDTITERIGNAIIANGLLAKQYVIEYDGDIDDLLQSPPGDKFVVIAPLALVVEPGSVEGGGAEWTEFDGQYRVDTCCRVLERENRSTKLQSPGVYQALVRNVMASLQVKPILLRLPILTMGNTERERSPLIEPMRLISATFNPRKPKPGWAYCRTIWSTKFRTDLRSIT